MKFSQRFRDVMLVSMLVSASETKKFDKHTPENIIGDTVIIGRKVYEELQGPLLHRRVIIISRDPSFRADGHEVVESLRQALFLVKQAKTDGVLEINTANITSRPQGDVVNLQFDGITLNPILDNIIQ